MKVTGATLPSFVNNIKNLRRITLEHKGFTHDILFSTTQVDQVFSALASAQGEFEPLEKAHDGYRGKYADLSDIKKATKKALAKYNLLITHACDQSKIVSVLGHSSGQHITYITKFSKSNKSDKEKNFQLLLNSEILKESNSLVLVPVVKSTLLSEFEEEITVSLESVSSVASVTVPLPTSN